MTAFFLHKPLKTYTGSIEFRTKIFTSHNGHEQRQSDTVYPKRTFVLQFAKNKTNREAIETFFKTLEGRNGEFFWRSPSTLKNVAILGPNSPNHTKFDRGFVYTDGKKYLCRLGHDEMQINILPKGYGIFQLTFETIDTYEVTDNQSDFTLPYKKAYSGSLLWDTNIDDIFTNRIKSNANWDSAKRKWLLEFEKGKINTNALIDFFKMKRGAWKSFNFNWATDRGGDGATYKVRFDTDKLDFTMFTLGYSKMSLPLIEVF